MYTIQQLKLFKLWQLWAPLNNQEVDKHPTVKHLDGTQKSFCEVKQIFFSKNYILKVFVFVMKTLQRPVNVV